MKSPLRLLSLQSNSVFWPTQVVKGDINRALHPHENLLLQTASRQSPVNHEGEATEQRSK